jgi:hypothetical protein
MRERLGNAARHHARSDFAADQLSRNRGIKRAPVGALCGLTGLYVGMRGQERVAVLLSALGKVELAKADIEAV